MNNLTGLIPIIYAALQVVSRELVGFIPAVSRNMSGESLASHQTVRVPITPASGTHDIVPGNPTRGNGTNFSYEDMAITKNQIGTPIVWNGDEELAVGSQLNQMVVNQYAQSMRSLVNTIERDIALEATIGALRGGNVTGIAGSTPFASNLNDLSLVKKIQDDIGAPAGDRHLIINTTTGMALRNLPNLINVNQAGETDMLRRGVISDLMGYAVRESGGYAIMNPGNQASIVTAGAQVEGATSIAVGALSDALNIGAIIQLEGDYYVVTVPAITGATVINIAPELQKRIPAGTTGVVLPSYFPNVAFSRDFIYLVTRAPAMPRVGDEARDVINVSDPVSGLGFQVALYAGYKETRVEIGISWGVKAINKKHGVLLLG